MSVKDVNWVSRSEATKWCVRNFVAGRLLEGRGARTLDKYCPRDGRLLYQFQCGVSQDADDAIACTRASFEDGRWAKTPAQHRKEVLHQLASSIEAHREELALLESLDTGKPITDALNFDVPTTVASLRFSAEAADKCYGKVYGVDLSSLSYELRRPAGVTAGIVGWNFPLYQTIQKIGPALAAGNSMVLKPSELTCLSAARVAELALEAGVPEGVFNVVQGDGDLGAVLARHPDVDLLTFTGSTETGKKLLVAAAESNMKRLILECGGKAPNIVFEDCPSLEAVANAVLASAFWNQGQVCVASSRLLVQESVYEDLLKCLVERASVLSPGDPLDPNTKFGALISESHKRKVLGYLESAEQEGGVRRTHQSSAPPPFERGFYVQPIIFDRVSPRHKIAREEIFGPVLGVIPFRDEEEAVRIANNSIYGLSAILWTKDLGRAHRVSCSIRAGWTVVNATARPQGGPGEGVLPIGGHKQSGIGTEGGLEGLEAYMSKTAVQIFV